MAQFSYDTTNTPPWTQVFIELAVRALLRVHHDYLAWGIEQRPNVQPDISQLNSGSGILLADEPAVCAAITQEFLASRYSSGVWFDDNENCSIERGHRFFRLTRESRYQGTPKRADFRCARVESNGTEKEGEALIEAKRAFRISTKLDSEESSAPVNQSGLIKDDIQRLREYARASPKGTLRGYVLIWHVTGISDSKEIGPVEYVNSFGDADVNVWQTRCIPLAADQIQPGSLGLSDRRITRWMWVVIAQVTPLKTGDMRI